MKNPYNILMEQDKKNASQKINFSEALKLKK